MRAVVVSPYPLIQCDIFLTIGRWAIHKFLSFYDSLSYRAFKQARSLATRNMLFTRSSNVCPDGGMAIWIGAVDSALSKNSLSQFQFYSMNLQDPERLNERDHCPLGICFPPGNGMCARAGALPSDLVRTILIYPQTGDPNFNSTQ